MAGRPFRLAERDVWLLEAIGKVRFVTTSQLARLAFGGSRSAANKRLRKLLDARLVRAWVRDLAKDNVYSLGRAGARLVPGAEPGEETWTVPRGLDGRLDHLLAINAIRVALAVDAAKAGGGIRWWRSDWELRAQFREPLVPDALFAVDWDGGGGHVFALEVDNQGRSTRAFARKVLRYRSLIRQGVGLYGVAEFAVLVVARDSRWTQRYREVAGHLRLGEGRIWFTSLAAVDEQGGLGRIWRGVGADGLLSLRAVGSLPYGKEGAPAETPVPVEG